MESNEGTLYLTAFKVETQTLVFPIILKTLDANFGDLKKQLGHVTACQGTRRIKTYRILFVLFSEFSSLYDI